MQAPNRKEGENVVTSIKRKWHNGTDEKALLEEIESAESENAVQYTTFVGTERDMRHSEFKPLTELNAEGLRGKIEKGLDANTREMGNKKSLLIYAAGRDEVQKIEVFH